MNNCFCTFDWPGFFGIYQSFLIKDDIFFKSHTPIYVRFDVIELAATRGDLQLLILKRRSDFWKRCRLRLKNFDKFRKAMVTDCTEMIVLQSRIVLQTRQFINVKEWFISMNPTRVGRPGKVDLSKMKETILKYKNNIKI